MNKQKAAEKYALKSGFSSDKDAFLAGVEFAGKWEKVKPEKLYIGRCYLIAEPFQSNKDAPIKYYMHVSYWDGSICKYSGCPQFPDGQDEQPGFYHPEYFMELPEPPKP